VFLVVIRRNVISVLVEGDGTVAVAHIDFEFAGGTAAFPAVVGVSKTEIFLSDPKGQPAAGQQFHIQKAKKKPTQVGDVGHVLAMTGAGRVDCLNQRDENDSCNKILRPDRKRNWKKPNLLVAIEQPECHQDAQHPSGSSNCRDIRSYASQAG